MPAPSSSRHARVTLPRHFGGSLRVGKLQRLLDFQLLQRRKGHVPQTRGLPRGRSEITELAAVSRRWRRVTRRSLCETNQLTGHSLLSGGLVGLQMGSRWGSRPIFHRFDSQKCRVSSSCSGQLCAVTLRPCKGSPPSMGPAPPPQTSTCRVTSPPGAGALPPAGRGRARARGPVPNRPAARRPGARHLLHHRGTAAAT